MNQDFVDLLRALSDVEARFLVVGAYAVAVHGRPRATGDLDIWIESAPINAERVYRALLSFGAPLNELTQSDLTTPGTVFQMGRPPRRIDIITSASGIGFSQAWQNKTMAMFGDLLCPVIGLEDLLMNKRATGRPKDLADVHELENLAATEQDEK